MNANRKLHDAVGDVVTREGAANAVKWFAELWKSGQFDCGPQDYEYMVRQVLEREEVWEQMEDKLDLPEVRRRSGEPTVRCTRTLIVESKHKLSPVCLTAF